MKVKQLKVDYDTPLEKQFKELGVKNYLHLEYVKDLFPRPKDDTIYDVEDGTEAMGVAPRGNEEKFRKEGRRGLTIHEGLALIRHNPKILDHHFIDLCGSRSGEARVPCVYRRGDRPALSRNFGGSANPDWGAASCGSENRPSESGTSDLENRILALEEFKKKVEGFLILP